ncbi:OmpA family protein [Aquimarina sp. 2201CG1-2-11]|uniref:OmpA family protein n=1 Tax=Aquimarina discodermiae TaxID=3231043 RepID=UPI0034627660
MKNLTIHIFLLCFFSVSYLLSQDNKFKKANDYYDSYAYSEAIKEYNQIINSGNATLEVYQRLGDCYFFNSDLKTAAKWYEEMFKERALTTKEKLNKEIGVEYYFKASQCLKHLKEYKKADSLLVEVATLKNSDSRAKRLLENPTYLEDIRLQSGRYTIKNLPRNSAYVDFAPVVYKNKLVFSSARGTIKSTAKKNRWTQQPYLDLFSLTLKESGDFEYPESFSKDLNSRLHESTCAFSKKEDVIYFTRNNLLNSKFGKDSTGVNRLKIYKAQLNDKSRWDSVEDLSFNNDEYSVAHPALSPDGTKLYFASDMPGGYGMSDLYVVKINQDGSFSTPQNLGPTINTEGRDTFPFISESGVLYFSSDGHLGLGGLDIFAVKIDGDDTTVYNIGEPINSVADDVTFVFDESSKKGFFASNRSGGKGNDDIYSFVETTPLITKCEGGLKVIVVNEKSGEVLDNAGVEIKNKDNNDTVYIGKTNEKGEVHVNLDCGDKFYEVFVKKADYDPAETLIEVKRDNPYPFQTVNLKSNVPEKGIDLAKLLNLKPIYFASNKALILDKSAKELDKVIKYMKEYPSIKIEIGSHTDSKGSDYYNMKLSKKRATATANYIISKGIDPSRVKSRGYGETVLINRCDNNVKCGKDEHAQNRRSEFIVIDN